MWVFVRTKWTCRDTNGRYIFLLAIWGSNSLIEYQLYVKVGYTPSSYWQLGKSVFEKMQQLVACIFYTLSRIDPARDKALCSFCFPEHEVFSQLASPGYNIYNMWLRHPWENPFHWQVKFFGKTSLHTLSCEALESLKESVHIQLEKFTDSFEVKDRLHSRMLKRSSQ